VRYNGPANGGDSAAAIETDEDGNVFVAGLSYGGATAHDFVVVKYDASGTEAWASRYNGPANGDDAAIGLALDDAGNVYVTGSSHGVGSDIDFATVKYDGAGVEQWVARYDGSGHGKDLPVDIVVNEEGTVFVAGTSQGSAISTVAYAPDGSQLWARLSGTPRGGSFELTGAAAMTLNPEGGIYIAGTASKADDRCGGSVASANYVTIAYGPDGSERWTAQYDGPCHKPGRFAFDDVPQAIDDVARAMAVDRSGNAYVSGVSGGNATTIKYTPSGEQVWVTTYDAPGDGVVEPSAMAIDTMGRLVLTAAICCENGYFVALFAYDLDARLLWATRYDADWDEIPKAIAVTTAGDVVVAGTSGSFSSAEDYLTLAYDANGQWLWAASYDGPGGTETVPQRWLLNVDTPSAITVDIEGNVFVTGTSDGGATDHDFATLRYTVR
jgi:hypothetical protein